MPTTCPNCSAPATGRFCAECGVALDGAVCAGCRTPLSPGAKFCHRCGTPAGATPPTSPREAPRAFSNALPWAVAALSLLAVVALVAGQRFAAARPSPSPAPTAPVGATAQATPPAPGAGQRAPDISQLSPRERADRLFDRLMRLTSEGKVDSVQFFAPMALSAYQSLGSLDIDLRYDYGRVAEVTGEAAIARAQADSILLDYPTHLLGLVLGARAAAMRGDETARKAFDRRLLAAEPAERGKQLVEYERHQADILNALADARRTP